MKIFIVTLIFSLCLIDLSQTEDQDARLAQRVQNRIKHVCNGYCSGRYIHFPVKKWLGEGNCKETCKGKNAQCCKSLKFYYNDKKERKEWWRFAKIRHFNKSCKTIHANWCCCYKVEPEAVIHARISDHCAKAGCNKPDRENFVLSKKLGVGDCKSICFKNRGMWCNSSKYFPPKNGEPFRIHLFYSNTTYANYCCCYKLKPRTDVKQYLTEKCKERCKRKEPALIFALSKVVGNGSCKEVCRDKGSGAKCCQSLRYYPRKDRKPSRIHYFNGTCNTIYSNYCCCYKKSPGGPPPPPPPP